MAGSAPFESRTPFRSAPVRTSIKFANEVRVVGASLIGLGNTKTACEASKLSKKFAALEHKISRKFIPFIKRTMIAGGIVLLINELK